MSRIHQDADHVGELAPEQRGPFRLGPGTEVPGLFLTGASTPSGAGISGVMSGGIATASAVLETDLWKPIRDGDVLGDRAPEPLPSGRGVGARVG